MRSHRAIVADGRVRRGALAGELDRLGYEGAMTDPWCLVVAGVSGAGKSTVATVVADLTGAALADGDDFHTASSVEKMRTGVPLADADRWPWLDAIGGWIGERYDARENAVISCSALRRRYRDRLATGRPWVRFCLLDVGVEELERRQRNRTGHFMPASLLASQLDTREPLGADEPGAGVDAVGTPRDVAAAVVRELLGG